MRHSPTFLLAGLITLVLGGGFFACTTQVPPDGEVPTPSAGAELKWYTTCGAPVCGNPNAPVTPNTCGANQEGAVCGSEGSTCDLGNDCQQQLVCAKADPKLQPGGCPISKLEFKQQIHYLTPAERGDLANQLQNLPLATWKYRFDPQGPQRLGFMITANTPPSLVKPDGNSVDLYGYLSMAVATLQEQDSKIKALEKQLQAISEQVKSCSAEKK